MGLLDFFAKKKRTFFSVIGSDIAVSHKKEAMRNVWVVSAIEAICEALIQMGMRGNDVDIFDRGLLSRSEMVKIITYDLLLSGNAFLYKTDIASKLALVPLDPSRVRLQASDSRIEAFYDTSPIDYESIIHIRNIIPNETGIERMIIGDSVIKQIIDIILLDNRITQLNLANVNTNNLTLIASFREFVDEATIKRLEAHIRRELEQNKKLNFLISPVPLDVKEISSSAETLYLQTQRENAIKILSVFRVPPIILGFGDTGNYVNRREQLRAFYENAVFPIASKIETAFAKHKLDIAFNRENVAVLQETLSEKISTLAELVAIGYPLEQASEMLGLPIPQIQQQNQQESIKHYQKYLEKGIKTSKDLFENTYNSQIEDAILIPEEQASENIQNLHFSAPSIHIPVHIYEIGEEIKQKFYQEHSKTAKLMKPKILRMLTTNRVVFFEKYAERIKEAYQKNNIIAIQNILEEWLTEVDALSQTYIRGIYMRVLDDFDEVFKLKIANEFVRKISKAVASKKQAERTATVNRTMVKRIVSISSEYIREGRTVLDLATALEHEFKIQRNRAAVIARTETTSLLNAYGYEQAVRADAQVKIWLTAHDERVRHSHRRNDYLAVRIEDKFPNGLRYPGDPNGRLEEIINCRCTLIFE